MGKVVVVGAGGHALVVIDVLRNTGQEVLGCVSGDGRAGCGLPVPMLGRAAAAADLARRHEAAVFVAIGDNRARQRVQTELAAAGVAIATAVSPQAIVAPSVSMGAGTLIMPGAIVNAQARIGAGGLVNTAAVVEHECSLGDFVHLGPGSVLAGRVAVGPGAFIGAGATVIPGQTIGEWAVVGAGAVVVCAVPASSTVVGVPARLPR